MKIINTKSFKNTLRDIHKNTENRKFCFVIGAGASRKSGIPTGAELAAKWFEEIKERLDDAELKLWMNEQKINEKDLAASYGSIYRKRFENDKTSGYEFLVQAMKNAKPSFGHIVLAQILSRTFGNCILTTNFDSLVESSVYQFTNRTPLVCGHESLSGYARPSPTHPLIIKIHRDLLLEPKSDPDEINKLDSGWKEPLDHIFSTHIPIIIGYGGNDGSLMSYFENMNKPSNFFWCGLDEKKIAERIKELIIKHNGVFVKIDGFDQFMYELLWVFDEIKPIKDELNEITNERISMADKQYKELTKIIININKTEKVITSQKDDKQISAFEYRELAEKETDFEKRKKIYLDALEKYPTTGWFWWSFTYFLHFIKKDYSELNEYYEKALKYNKDKAGLLGNYASYLHTIKKDYPKAEEFYLKALSIDDKAANILGNYASYLETIKKDYPKAEEFYLKALSIDDKAANILGNYANYLQTIKKDYPKAEEFYLKALSIDDKDANILGDYASYLETIKKDYPKAEEFYLKALSIDDKDAINLCNYASYLETIKKDYPKAEEFYLKALSIDDKDANVLGNYASYLKTIKKDYPKAEEFYLKALSIDDKYANILGNYANYLQTIKKDYPKAEEFYLKALSIDDKYANVLGNYANYLKTIKKDYPKAEEFYLKALSIDDKYANVLGNYAQFLLEKGDIVEGKKYVEKALSLLNEENDLLIELWFYRYAHFREFLIEAENKIEELLRKGIRSLDWDFSGNIKQAIKDGHPNLEKLREFARKITSE